MNSSPVLVAPRPVRFTTTLLNRAHPIAVRHFSAPVEQLERSTIIDENASISPSNSDFDEPNAKLTLVADCAPSSTHSDIISPRLSPRASLPSEALEEFLSILRPSFFPHATASPIVRARILSPPLYRPNGTSYAYTAQASPRTRLGLELTQQKSEQSGDSVIEVQTPTTEYELYDTEGRPVRWFTSSALSSPISRMNTRNPFQRHPSYEIAFSGLLPSSPSLSPQTISPLSPLSPAVVPPSPTTVPLPSPTAEEMAMVTM